MKRKNFKKVKNDQFIFFLHFATTTDCNVKFWKIDPPYNIQYVPILSVNKHASKGESISYLYNWY